MKTVAAAIVVAFAAAGCAGLEPRTAGTPVTEPSQERRIDCDLIFPGGADRR